MPIFYGVPRGKYVDALGMLNPTSSSLPGLTRQSILFERILSKIDGYAGQARV
jgi:hypothetical protein